jgi:hypothetical protein
MRLLVLLALLSSSASDQLFQDKVLERLNDTCRALGGVGPVSYRHDAVSAECRDGLKVTIYRSPVEHTVDDAPW